MKSLKTSVLPGLTVLSLALSSLVSRNALAQTAPAPTTSSSQDYVSAWRLSAKKNFLEGFCVGQTLAAQQVTIQAGQQIDQAMANTVKAAIVTCKAKNKAPAAPN
jgi:hypothetical protein